jgi:pyrroline-5-carboxylate reductase
MLRDLRVAIIGAGAIGEAIIGGLLRQELVSAEQIVISHPREDRRRELHARFGVQMTSDNTEAAHWGRIVIFAVKPQMLQRVLPPLRDALGADDLAISVVAGATLRSFADALNHPVVVRSMPNTPAQIGEGMIVWTAAQSVTETQQAWARTVLSALGRELYVDNEQYLDMATALSGTGPAYFFLLMEAMIDAGVHLGLSRRIAEELVQQTMLGSVRYAQQSNLHPAQLRNAVTSPGGTSAAALSELERGGLRTVFADAIWAAYRRSVELGKSSGSQ